MSKADAVQEVRDWYDAHIPFWAPRRRRITECGDFLDGDRYEYDPADFNRDRKLTKIKGQEIQDTVRHVVAKATEKARNVQPRPRSGQVRPEMIEMAAALVAEKLEDPWNCFDDEYEAALQDCRERCLGLVMMDWDPDLNLITHRWTDPRRVMWDESYMDPHHPKCGVLFEEKRLDVETARRIYKKPWLMPDRESFEHGRMRSGLPVLWNRAGSEIKPGDVEDEKVTLWFQWRKNDRTMKAPRNEEGAPLPAGNRYLVCASGCGYRSPTEGVLKQAGKVETELPEELPGGCPTCGGNLERVDVKDQTIVERAYRNGKRLIIVSPWSPGPEGEPVYDGAWPIPEARSFPILVLTAYAKGGEPVPPCDTIHMWDQQVALDNLRTSVLQRTFGHRTLWEFPKDGLYDYKGRRFEKREDQFDLMFRDAAKQQFAAIPVQAHNASGLDPQFGLTFSLMERALTQYRGVTDLGPVDPSSQKESGVAIAQRNQIGEIPVAHFNRRKNRSLSRYYGVFWDYLRATLTPEEMTRMRFGDTDLMAELQGDDLPDLEFVIAESPEFTGLEEARATAWDQGYQVATTDPDALEAWGHFHNIPPSVVRALEELGAKKMEQMKAQEETARIAAIAAGAAGPPQGNEKNGAPKSQSNGAGMVPSLTG
jgi:hypothetical protein